LKKIQIDHEKLNRIIEEITLVTKYALIVIVAIAVVEAIKLAITMFY